MTATADAGGGPAALARLVRDEGPRVLATLVRTTGSLELAQDAVQDAVVRALEVWAREGVPTEPRAWLTLTARRRAIDLLRREHVRVGKEAASSALLAQLGHEEPPADAAVVRDDLLRLLFTCCHPALSTQTQTALALRTLCGLSTAEVASALLVSEATMAKRLTRARQKIAAARIPYRVPSGAELPERLDGVLTTVYLLFNEGYHASAGSTPLRRQLSTEAIRLAALLRELLPDQIPVYGLEALLRLQDARSPARLDARGDPVRLADQDRSRWDRAQVGRGLSLLGVALRLTTAEPDPYVVQAAIAACHDLAPTWADTNWPAIVSWYDVLLTVQDTPVVRLNRAVAVAERDGPQAGLAEIEAIGSADGMSAYLPLTAARAELLARVGRLDEARSAFQAALSAPGNDATKRELARRLAELTRVPTGLLRMPRNHLIRGTVGAGMTTWGFIGSGHIGSTVARLATAAGHDVVLSNSRGPDTLADLVADLGPRARAATTDEAAAAGDIVVVTIPLKAYRDVPVEPLRGKTVIDTMNYYWQRDGRVPELDDGSTTSSQLLQAHLPQSHVVKVFNNITSGHLGSLARPAGSPDRSALAIAGDDPGAKQYVTALLDEIGYDAVDLGPLSEGWRIQPGTSAYGVMYASEPGDFSSPPRAADADTVAAAAASATR